MKNYKNLDLNDLEGEIWKEIHGYNNDYLISNLGRVKSLKQYKEGKILKQYADRQGFLYVYLRKNGEKPKKEYVHGLNRKNAKIVKVFLGDDGLYPDNDRDRIPVSKVINLLNYVQLKHYDKELFVNFQNFNIHPDKKVFLNFYYEKVITNEK